MIFRQYITLSILTGNLCILNGWGWFLLEFFDLVLTTLFTVVPFLMAVAMLILSERKILATVQKRQGPNVVGPFGSLQSVSDGFKLIIKMIVLPTRSNKTIFFIFPIASFIFSFSA